MRVTAEQLQSFLVDTGLITRDDFVAAEKRAKKKNDTVEHLLISEGKIPADEMVKLKGHILGVPFVDLTKEKISYEVLSLVPEPIARKNAIIAYKKEGNTLEVAMTDPGDLPTVDFIRKQSGLSVKVRLTSEASIKRALEQYQKSLEAEFGDIIEKEKTNVIGDNDTPLEVQHEGDQDVEATGEDLKKMAEDVPIIKIVDTLLRHAILQKASDIHIEPQDKEMVVRYRIDGILHDAMTFPRRVASGIIARIKVLSDLRLDEHRLPQDGRFGIETDGAKISFRVSTIPVFDGEKAVMRLLPENNEGFTLEALGFHGTGLDRLHEALKKTVGMVLVTGPTGSGKTTTLYTSIDILNTAKVNIATIEDPIEYRMGRINQTQVRPDIGFTFANGLRSLVRQDPDVIMIGEIRDGETAGLAVNAALTGHVVLSTLHTNSSAGALPRLVDMGVEPFLIVSTVNVIVAQRLVRKLCDDKEKYTLSESEIKRLEKEINIEKVIAALKEEKIIKSSETIKTIPFYRPKTTADCPDGYKGRVGIYEVFEVTPTIKQLVMQSATADQISKQAETEGMLTMIEDGLFKAVQGVTSIEEVLRVIRE